MLRTVVTILLTVMVIETVTVAADAEWEMSEFVILLGWASHGDHPDDEAKMAAIAQAGFNTVMWYNAGQLDLAHQYGLKMLNQVKPPNLIADFHREHPANWGYYVGDEPPVSEYPAMAAPQTLEPVAGLIDTASLLHSLEETYTPSSDPQTPSTPWAYTAPSDSCCCWESATR